ncbi:cytochrome c550 [Gracilibacillus salinarum]|uniref:Cytochrome c n=1 Tax=Gracilibacillus salinarum TaxID=2932255 RepID=A0ABY4GP92_9BACI|nr:cytochrome c [Gracilibacillus salinarum]UOQ86031.1 cytochrome c [Gracilibacillus salinarum]
MKKNPIIPFALIAVLGIIAMIIISAVGVNEQDKIANGGGETEEAADPQTLIQNCTGCHGGNLEGATGPNLQNIGDTYSVEEIQEIIVNGREDKGMPGGLVSNEEAAVLAEWLAEGQGGE